MPFARLKLLLVCTLIASTALFAIGVAIERSHSETTGVSGGEVSHTGEAGSGGETGGSTEGGSGAEGSAAPQTATTAETSGPDAVFLGINLESWTLVGVAVVLSLGLALAIWFRPLRPVLLVTAVFALVFAVFDVAEVSHQVSASKTGLVAIATVVALLHLSTAGLSVAGSRSPDIA
jgi:hypothetical protein